MRVGGDCHLSGFTFSQRFLTSRADTNCRGRRATFRSAVLVSRSYRAPAMLVSSSDGFWRDGLFGAILLSWGELMIAVVVLVVM